MTQVKNNDGKSTKIQQKSGVIGAEVCTLKLVYFLQLHYASRLPLKVLWEQMGTVIEHILKLFINFISEDCICRSSLQMSMFHFRTIKRVLSLFKKIIFVPFHVL